MAGGVPAMCDGVTQGQDGMELSLMSRDVIAMSAAVGLSHNMFDGALFLGICDKIVPGLVMAALSFGHLPALFVPAGPMSSGLPNKEKVRVRQLYAEGKADRPALLEAEAASYHGIGTCTFYGTANTNQMVMEVMGLHLPGASFVHPDTPLRDALNDAAARQVTRLTDTAGNYLPIGRLMDEKVVVNGIVSLLATGGSTNLTMHLVAMARAAGIIITGTISRSCRRRCRCCAASTRTARPTSTSSSRRRRAAGGARAAATRAAARRRAHRGRFRPAPLHPGTLAG